MGVSLYQSQFISGISKSTSFNIPILSIGNLTVGGTGKSPHIEYLIKLLSDYVNVGVLSRGYRRRTVGHILLNLQHTAAEVGDEPLQMKKKFSHIPIAVNKNRSIGIPKLLKEAPEIQVVLLDDAFQHLEVKPYLNILLTEFENPYSSDYLLPSGRLREWRFGHYRAQIIVVTKCPDNLHDRKELIWREKLKLRPSQHLFFSYLRYGDPYNIFSPSEKFLLNENLHVILVSAIAQSSYLGNYLMPKIGTLTEYQFEDHHYFNEEELIKIIDRYKSVSTYNKIFLTTEKDATRLEMHRQLFETHEISVFAIPVEVEFYDKYKFDQLIKQYLLDFKA